MMKKPARGNHAVCALAFGGLLLFAVALAEAQPDQNKPPRFAVKLSKSTVAEGESVTVGLRCTANCTPDRFALWVL